MAAGAEDFPPRLDDRLSLVLRIAGMTQFRCLELGESRDIWEIIPERFADARGVFSEVYNRELFRRHAGDLDFVQDNHSISRSAGTVRGLHFQSHPFAQAKLIRVVRGAIFDVAVDLRRGSPTYGRHVSLTVSSSDWNQVFIPVGFAHGFCTLEPDTEVLYKVDQFYSSQHEHGVLWNDSGLGIRWPIDQADAVISEKDKSLPRFRDIATFFTFPAERTARP
jgi:dTDP-4-dehydrorhamnose 3,5-epimerase